MRNLVLISSLVVVAVASVAKLMENVKENIAPEVMVINTPSVDPVNNEIQLSITKEVSKLEKDVKEIPAKTKSKKNNYKKN